MYSQLLVTRENVVLANGCQHWQSKIGYEDKLSGMSLPGWLRDCSQLVWSLVNFLSSLHWRCQIICKHSPTTLWTVVKLWKEWHKKNQSLCLQSKSCAFEKCWLQRSDKISTLKVEIFCFWFDYFSFTTQWSAFKSLQCICKLLVSY